MSQPRIAGSSEMSLRDARRTRPRRARATGASACSQSLGLALALRPRREADLAVASDTSSPVVDRDSTEPLVPHSTSGRPKCNVRACPPPSPATEIRARDPRARWPRLAAEKGYAAVTIDDIARAARISKRTFYDHFADKERASWPPTRRRPTRSHRGSGRGRRPPRTAWRARVDAVIATYLKAMAAQPEMTRVFHVEIQAAGAEALDLHLGGRPALRHAAAAGSCARTAARCPARQRDRRARRGPRARAARGRRGPHRAAAVTARDGPPGAPRRAAGCRIPRTRA